MSRCTNENCYSLPMAEGDLCINCRTVQDVTILAALCMVGCVVIVAAAVLF